MSTLSSIPVSDPKRFLALQDVYKQELMGDQRLDEASEVAAHRQLLLENPHVDPHWALPQVKAMMRKLNHLTQRIRQPFGTVTSSRDLDEEDTADDFAASPVQALAKRLMKPLLVIEPLAIKQTPANKPVRKRREQLTPKVTPTPRRPLKPLSPITGLTSLASENTPEYIDRQLRTLFNEDDRPFVLRKRGKTPPPPLHWSTPTDLPEGPLSSDDDWQLTVSPEASLYSPPLVQRKTTAPRVNNKKRKAKNQAKKVVKRKAYKTVSEKGTRALSNWLQFK